MMKFLKKHIIEIFLFVILFAGLSLILYPSVSNWWNSLHQSQAIASYVESVDSMSKEEIQAIFDAAYAYNERLAEKGNNIILSKEEEEEYQSLLNVSGTGIMGYIQIPSIDVYAPIYHGTEETVLQIAIGHLSGSSLPVGGASTHTLLSGHRGLPSARLFTDLDQLEEGDIFTITVLNRTITYQVDQIRIVLPEETGELPVIEGEDYCTLITCTPYGVNSHRMLVRGRRTDNIAGGEDLVLVKEAVKLPTTMVMLAVGIPLLFVLLAILLIYYRFKKPKKKAEELLEELRKE